MATDNAIISGLIAKTTSGVIDWSVRDPGQQPLQDYIGTFPGFRADVVQEKTLTIKADQTIVLTATVADGLADLVTAIKAKFTADLAAKQAALTAALS